MFLIILSNSCSTLYSIYSTIVTKLPTSNKDVVLDSTLTFKAIKCVKWKKQPIDVQLNSTGF